MLVMGVDENGLGPRLGPLVASSITLDVPRYRRASLVARGLALGLTDSKELGGFGRMAFTESVALGLLQRVWGSSPATADALLDSIAPSLRESLRPYCPNRATAAQCWSIDVPLPAFGGDAERGAELLERLVGRSHLRIVDVQSRLACVGLLNAELEAGRNKLAVDLRLFEDLIGSVYKRFSGPLEIHCGMVGGIRDYASRFSRLSPSRVQPLSSRAGQRRYLLEGIGEVRFEVDADARHLPVSLASIVGKYVRELSMHRIGRFYTDKGADVPLASGYHDPVTTRFIDGSREHRRTLGIAGDCFMRRA